MSPVITLDFRYFFVSEAQAPAHLSLAWFGREHIIWLALIALFILLLSFYYRGLNASRRSSFKKSMAIFIILFELLRQLIYLALGRYQLDYLPLHLCGLTELVILIYAFTHNKYAKEALYALGILGALMALLFADWLVFPLLHFQSIHGFAMHGILMGFIMMLLFSGELRPNARNLPIVFVFLMAVVSVLYVFNQRFLTNFFFLRYPSPGSPLVMFETWAGNPGYIFVTLTALLIVWALMYLPWRGYKRTRG
jgi:hypothetical integral membrane protein (TIGR02206 family)